MTRNLEIGTSLIHVRENGEIVSVEKQDDEANLQDHVNMFGSFLKGIGFVGVSAVVLEMEAETKEDIRSDYY